MVALALVDVEAEKIWGSEEPRFAGPNGSRACNSADHLNS
jgi:hypothetical protein